MSLLRPQGLTVRIGGKTLLHDASLSPRAGELLGIVGSNGAGKTTLLRTLAGLTRAAQGRVLLPGRGSLPTCRKARPCTDPCRGAR